MNPNKVFQTTIVDDIFIVELVGVVSSLADDRITRELDAVRERIKVGKHLSVIVDLGHVAYFGSSMLEAIRVLWNDLAPNNGRLVLCNASEVGREILQIAKFDHLWPLLGNRDDAIRSLQA